MPRFTSFLIHFLSAFLIISHANAFAAPSFIDHSPDLQRRTTDPYFPPDPPSCPLCAANYPNINHCAAACPVFANFSMILFNPGAFIDVIQCSCTETFQSVFPQCVDCFLRTGQENVLTAKSQDLPAIVDGMRKICAIASTLLGGAVTANGEVTPTTSIAVPTPTSAATTTTDGIILGTIAMLALTFALVINFGLVI